MRQCKRYVRWILGGAFSCLGLMLLACGPQEPPEPAKQEQGLTYHKDIRPLLETKCLGCHQKGGIGPFALGTYEEVSRVKALVKDSVVSRRMPPWRADDSCNEYKHNFGLSDAQIKTISEWVDSGAKEGDPKSYKAQSSTPTKLREDLVVKMPTAYKPVRAGDDYRCFLVPWPKKEKGYVTGFQVTPGNKAIAHHLIAYVIPADRVSTFQEFDKSADGAGYPCFGGPTGQTRKIDPTLQTAIQWLGAWVPGQGANFFPKGTGIKMVPGSWLVLQMHYSSNDPDARPDQSQVSFQVADTVEREGRIMPVANPSWLLAKTMKIPAGAKNTTHSYSIDLTSRNGGKALQVYQAGLHLHTRGKSASLSIERAGGQEKDACVLRIPKWDFNWQSNHTLASPLILYPGDKLKLSRTWDNSAGAQPMLDGKRAEVRDLNWGDGTYDEMCLGVLYVTSAPQ